MFARQKSQPADRSKALGLAMDAIEKQFGKGSIWRLDGSRPTEPVAVHPVGCVGIDLALGVGDGHFTGGPKQRGLGL